MRVLHLYAGNLFGGVERALLALWRGRGACPAMSPHFALTFDAKLAADLRTDGAPVHVVGPARVSRPWTVWRTRRRLAHLLRAERFDVAVVHSLWPHCILAPVVRRAGLPLVTWLHDVPRPGGWLERWANATRPDLMLANSGYTRTRALTAFPRVACEVQHPPVELHEVADRAQVRREVRTTIGADERATVILIAARLQVGKGHVPLIDALARLRDRPGWECWIAGGPQRRAEQSYLAHLRRHVRAQRLDGRVKFLGQRDDVPRLLAAADVLCQPNLLPEGFGLTFVEALSASVPVVTSDLGGAREIVDDACGRLVPPGDVPALAEALTELMDDPNVAESLGRAGPPRARALCAPEVVLPALTSKLARVRI